MSILRRAREAVSTPRDPPRRRCYAGVQMRALGYTLFETSLGAAATAWSERGLVSVLLPERDVHATVAGVERRHPGLSVAAPPASVLEAVEGMRALLAATPSSLSGPRALLLDVALDDDGVPDFARRVHQHARGIPPGQTRTYGEVARALGVPGGARAVGHALGHNPYPIVVPCHRVLGARGRMVGFSAPGGVLTKRRMLAIEGAALGESLSLFDRE